MHIRLCEFILQMLTLFTAVLSTDSQEGEEQEGEKQKDDLDQVPEDQVGARARALACACVVRAASPNLQTSRPIRRQTAYPNKH